MKALRLATTLAMAVALFAVLGIAGPLRAEDEGEDEFEDCMSCHMSEDEVGDPDYVIDEDVWDNTVHGGLAECIDCHGDTDGDPHQGTAPMSTCVDCHDDVVEELGDSIHGQDGRGGEKHPDCLSCHGPIHTMVASDDKASPIWPLNLPETCGNCHADPDFGKAAGLKLIQPIAAYAASVHARALAGGDNGATCSSCHGSHAILPAGDPASQVNRDHVVETCGGCHEEIAETFRASVHGQAVERGIRESPVCTDCHGEHRILSPADRGSPVFATNVPKMTCGRCHGDLRVTEKFGLKSDAVLAFEDSFHGLAGDSGRVTVANCASCHGVHDILPSQDPRSHINEANLAATCGNCHPGAENGAFAIGAVHVLPKEKDGVHPVVYWARVIYLWLIWLVIGAMVVHNLLDLRRKALSPILRPVVPVAKRRLRMSVPFRIAHFALLVSFTVLVWSGFALRYSEVWWAQPLVMLESEDFDLRGLLHRSAAIVMVAAFLFHLGHLAVSRQARACIRGMLPGRSDIHEFVEKMRWYFGRRPDMPKSEALSYVEKAEYLAVIWGTLLMAATGFLMWFENWSLANLPKWMLDLANVVHLYEAILASLAILVWHFYSVIFDPLVYPMDTTWLTGREAPGRTLERTESVIEPAGGEAGDSTNEPEAS